MSKPTIIRAVRDGQLCQLVQPVSKTGIPLCCNCRRSIPRSYRERRKGRPGWFCTDSCAITWANDVAGQVWVKREPAAPGQGEAGRGEGE